jgi:signal transduction histidine kinase
VTILVSEARLSGLRTLGAEIAKPILVVPFCLLCLLLALSNSGLSRNGFGLSSIVFLITGLAALRWMQRIRRQIRQTQLKNVELSDELGRMIDDLNRAQRSIEEKQLADRAAILRIRHDLLGPIGSISGFLQLLRDERYPLSSRQLEFVQNIDRSVSTLLRVISTMEEEQEVQGLLKKPVVSCRSIDCSNERNRTDPGSTVIHGAQGRR